MKKLAPIVLFAYSRPLHTQQTVKALQKNELAGRSELFIYSDGGKDEESWQKVNEVREYLKTISGFKNITIIEQEKNLGLADSIIGGVTNVVNKYGKIIVLEDDIVTSPYFLRFMNDALDFYENEEKIWHISGWNYPVENASTEDVFFWRVMNCYGWSTWANRWEYYKKDTEELIELFTPNEIYKFNLDGTCDFWSQVLANKEGKINTWAIYWYATIFQNKGLCVSPIKSFSRNIGFDSAGTHTKSFKIFDEVIADSYLGNFSNCICEHEEYTNQIKNFFLKNQKNGQDDLKKFNGRLTSFLSAIKNLEKSAETYILYGAGTGAEVALKWLEDKIVFIIDQNENIKTAFGKKVFNPEVLKEYGNHKIIISVFGRENEIRSMLMSRYQIKSSNIVLLVS